MSAPSQLKQTGCTWGALIMLLSLSFFVLCHLAIWTEPSALRFNEPTSFGECFHVGKPSLDSRTRVSCYAMCWRVGALCAESARFFQEVAAVCFFGVVLLGAMVVDGVVL